MTITFTQELPYTNWVCDQFPHITISGYKDGQGRERFIMRDQGYNLRNARTLRGAKQAARNLAREYAREQALTTSTDVR